DWLWSALLESMSTLGNSRGSPEVDIDGVSAEPVATTGGISCGAAGLGSAGRIAIHRTGDQSSDIPITPPSPDSQFPANEGLRLSCPELRRFAPQHKASHSAASIARSTAPRSSAPFPDAQPQHTPTRGTRRKAFRHATAQPLF